jgi:hypothetical protein
MLQVLPYHFFPLATGLFPHRSQALLGSVCSGKLCFPSGTPFTEYPIFGSGKQSFPARDSQAELGNHAEQQAALLEQAVAVLAPVYLTLLAALLIAALAAALTMRREPAIALALAPLFSVLAALSMTAAYSASEALYLPTAAAVGVAVGRLLRRPSLQGFFLAVLLTTTVSALAIRIYIRF